MLDTEVLLEINSCSNEACIVEELGQSINKIAHF